MRTFLACLLILCTPLEAVHALSSEADGTLIVDVDMSLIGDDNRFDFIDLLVKEGATLSADAATYPNGISIFASNDVIINGFVDFTGIDLEVFAEGLFEIGPTGGFYADDFNIEATSLNVPDDFQAVPGGHFDISDPGTGQPSFSGHGVIITTIVVNVPDLELVIDPINQPITLVPIPPAILLLGLPLAIVSARKKRKTSVS